MTADSPLRSPARAGGPKLGGLWETSRLKLVVDGRGIQ